VIFNGLYGVIIQLHAPYSLFDAFRMRRIKIEMAVNCEVLYVQRRQALILRSLGLSNSPSLEAALGVFLGTGVSRNQVAFSEE
jgi:hypothetical protein